MWRYWAQEWHQDHCFCRASFGGGRERDGLWMSRMKQEAGGGGKGKQNLESRVHVPLDKWHHATCHKKYKAFPHVRWHHCTGSWFGWEMWWKWNFTLKKTIPLVRLKSLLLFLLSTLIPFHWESISFLMHFLCQYSYCPMQWFSFHPSNPQPLPVYNQFDFQNHISRCFIM